MFAKGAFVGETILTPLEFSSELIVSIYGNLRENESMKNFQTTVCPKQIYSKRWQSFIYVILYLC